jgi:tetrahydromethanopterin S-methyltransferase subunit B
MEQLRLFEKESFEIQARIKRGFEAERENENIVRTVDEYREKERELNRIVEDLKHLMKLKDSDIDRVKGLSDNMSHLNKQLEREISELR